MPPKKPQEGGKERQGGKKKSSKSTNKRQESKNKTQLGDALDDVAMENALAICHNVQDLLFFRGFLWESAANRKGKAKGRRRKSKK